MWFIALWGVSLYINSEQFPADLISVLMEFMSQMLQISDMDKVVYDRTEDMFIDQVQTAVDWEQVGHN